jgi:myo-inositol 2-dehydrogenase / D-chiro-inositol 1-dehydrogenase
MLELWKGLTIVQKLKCGVIGLGRVGQMHVQNMLSMPEIEIVAVADVFIENMSDWLMGTGIQNASKGYKDVLTNEEVQAVLIFTSTDTHEELVTEAAKYGKYIFCEKPLSMSLDESKTLAVLRQVEMHNVKLQMAFNRRFDPQFLETYTMVREGKIGDPQIVKITSRDPDLLPHDLIKRIGGLIFDFTMHDFDMARYMMGCSITEVFVKGNTLIDPTLKDIDDVDTLAIILQFENGGYGIIDNSRKAVYGYDQRVEVFGSKGMLMADNVSNSTLSYYNENNIECKKPLPIFMERYKEAYKNEIRFFADSILNNKPILCTGEDVLLAQRVAIDCTKIIESGKSEKVALS